MGVGCVARLCEGVEGYECATLGGLAVGPVCWGVTAASETDFCGAEASVICGTAHSPSRFLAPRRGSCMSLCAVKLDCGWVG